MTRPGSSPLGMEGRPARTGQTGSGPFRGPFTEEEYGRQLAAKVARVQGLFPGVGVEVAPSPIGGHRHRGTFVVRDRRLGFARSRNREARRKVQRKAAFGGLETAGSF